MECSICKSTLDLALNTAGPLPRLACSSRYLWRNTGYNYGWNMCYAILHCNIAQHCTQQYDIQLCMQILHSNLILHSDTIRITRHYSPHVDPKLFIRAEIHLERVDQTTKMQDTEEMHTLIAIYHTPRYTARIHPTKRVYNISHKHRYYAHTHSSTNAYIAAPVAFLAMSFQRIEGDNIYKYSGMDVCETHETVTLYSSYKFCLLSQRCRKQASKAVAGPPSTVDQIQRPALREQSDTDIFIEGFTPFYHFHNPAEYDARWLFYYHSLPAMSSFLQQTLGVDFGNSISVA